MYYELYIDVFFLVNFMMDYLLLALVGRMLRLPAPHLRVMAGAAAGAFLSCVVTVIPGIHASVRFILFHGLINIFMLKAGLKIGWNKTFLRAFILLYISAFLMGGVMGYLHQYLRAGSLFFALAAAGYAVSAGILELLSFLAGRKASGCRVRLVRSGREACADALVDTGNRLRDSATGKPVSVISRRLAGELGITLPEDAGDMDELPEGIRYIPYHSVGKADGVMPVVTLDLMYVCGRPERRIERPAVAVCEEVMTDDDYEMLMNPDLL